jgi:hypothetical protein
VIEGDGSDADRWPSRCTIEETAHDTTTMKGYDRYFGRSELSSGREAISVHPCVRCAHIFLCGREAVPLQCSTHIHPCVDLLDDWHLTHD